MTKVRGKPLTPIERRAEVAKAVKLQSTTLQHVLKHTLHVSYNHLMMVLNDERSPSQNLVRRICDFVAISPMEFFGKEEFNASPAGRRSR